MNAPVIPFPSPMPTSAGGRAIWAKSLMVESARVWADAIKLPPNASSEDIAAAHDECADILDAFLQCARMFTEALDGSYRDTCGYLTDAIGDGLEYPLEQRLEDKAEDRNAEHKIASFEAGVGRYR